MEDNNLEINEINPASPDFRTDLADKIADLAPEAVADGKIDFEKLRELLSDDVSNASERFGLFWPGKKNAIRQAQTPTTATLKPDFENSKDWDNTENVFIEGDNLEVLKILQNHYYGKIKMIYIDPPYNTGKDFVYKDNFRDGIKTYKEWTQQVDEDGKALSSNADTDGRYHSNWLNMMYPRLKLARNLLASDGLIAVSIDENEYSNLKKLLDEIFGEINYRNTLVVRRRVKSLNSQFTQKGLNSFNVGTESVLIYSRSKQAVLAPLRVSKKNAPNKGRWDVFWSGADRPTMRYELLGFTPTSGQWRNSKAVALTAVKNYETFLRNHTSESLEEYSARTGITKFIRRNPDGKGKNGGVQHWVAPSSTMLRSSLWTDLEVSQINKEIELPFENPKNRPLIQEILKLVETDTGDIILDFFSGSSTTAHAVMQLNAEDGKNRNHIQIQLPEPVENIPGIDSLRFKTLADISRTRIKLSGEKIEQDFADPLATRTTPLDTGFRAYKLSDTNFVKWNFSSNMTEDELNQGLFELEDSSNDHARIADLFTELLLKQGLSLTERISQTEIAGLKLHAIIDDNGDFAMLAYLDEHTPPSLSQLREIIKTKPTRFVMLEDGFGGSDELKTNLVQICKTNNVELWTA
ncbi:site-specific DNA-methyltransferase [Corynebacterium pseudodiphtheriticum]|uniref:site-specific DNA-methyltransferase n=1 Tax=Corynebacterium pseudodiphtheriticum TaxID=37637 RepID=UPI00254F961E|nr:site-specific DNA-methyltransferase [Corynebacterium pseudodiphtheriticum]MDK8478428.1 site-specific DNA-methyltransferase [Corynebacterium pseudodiphtheriticum]